MTAINVKYTFISTKDYEYGGEGEERRMEILFTGFADKDGYAFGKAYKERYGAVLFEQYMPALERAAAYYQERTGCRAERVQMYCDGAEKGYEETR